jgi:two-component system chemotaxis response regulator CheB
VALSDADGASHGPGSVIGIGASAGGVVPLRAVIAGLPGDLPAAVLVVLHIPAAGEGLLAPILARGARLPAAAARDGEPLGAGRVYVAPADRHLTVRDGRVALTRGPKEHRVRPCADALFRSIGEGYGSAAVAVVLSGALDDGAAGAAVVAAHGGIVIAQSSADAAVPSMPLAAAGVAGAVRMAAAQMAPELARLAGAVRDRDAVP